MNSTAPKPRKDPLRPQRCWEPPPIEEAPIVERVKCEMKWLPSSQSLSQSMPSLDDETAALLPL